MAYVVEKAMFLVSPDRIWALIGGFGSLPDWIPVIAKLDLKEGGRVRRFSTTDSAEFTERLVSFDEAQRSYTYEIVQAPIPVGDYRSNLSVRKNDADKGSLVEWSGEFRPIGVSEQEAISIVSNIYRNGLDAIGRHFAAMGS
jgi:hypothetical protein